MVSYSSVFLLFQSKSAAENMEMFLFHYLSVVTVFSKVKFLSFSEYTCQTAT